jgi:hypothetical protein
MKTVLKYLPQIIIALFVAITFRQTLQLQEARVQSAVWAQRVAADSVAKQAFVDSLAKVAVNIAARDSVIATLRVAKTYPTRTAARAKVIADVAKAIAADTNKADTTRLTAYESAVAALEIQVKSQAEIIGYQEREIATLTEIRDIQTEALGDALRRITELQNLIEAAPAVQAKPKGPGPLKVIGGFLAGIGVGVVTGLVLR